MIERERRVRTIKNKNETLKLAKSALETKAEEFTRLVEEVTDSMAKEANNIGGMHFRGKLVNLEPHGEATIVGDIHGDLESLAHIINDSGFLQEANHKEDVTLIFLGDYGDRGRYSAEVYYVVFSLKRQFPKNVILMRGNHEGPKDLSVSPHDLPYQFQQRFGELGETAYSALRKLWDQLYTSVLVEDRVALIHGGFPTNARSVEDLADAHQTHPKTTFLEEMLWNDPDDTVSDAVASPRGAGRLFGENVTEALMEMLRVNVLIRGHEPCHDGFKLNHNGKVLTLFSRKGEPYFNDQGAYLRLNLSSKPMNAEKLLPWISQF